MTELAVILEKLDAQTERFKSIETSLKELSATVQKIAIQDERINHINSKVSKLWDLHDKEFGPEGVIAKLQQHQSQCPKEDIIELRKMFFGLLITFVTLFISGAITTGYFILRS